MRNWVSQFFDTAYDHMDVMMLVFGGIYMILFWFLGFLEFYPLWAGLGAFGGTIALTGTRVVMAMGQYLHYRRGRRLQTLTRSEISNHKSCDIDLIVKEP